MNGQNRDAYLAFGFCDAVHWSKAWCNLLAGHEGRHMSLGEPGYVPDLSWNDECNESAQK